MKIKLYEKGVKQEDNVFYLKLSEMRGIIYLELVDNDGKRIKKGTLLTFNDEYGTFSKMCGISLEFPLRTDEYGQIIIREDDTIDEMLSMSKKSIDVSMSDFDDSDIKKKILNKIKDVLTS